MSDNYPLGAKDDPNAPYNLITKVIPVTISQCLSTTVEIEIPKDSDENDTELLKAAVIEQIMLPSDCLENDGYFNWEIDDFCVI